LFAPVPAVYAASIETGYSPEGTALQLVLKTIDSAQQEIRLMGYSFTSPEVAGALVRAKRRGVDVKVVLDWKANTGKQNQASLAAMNLLVNAGIPVRTVSQYKIMHDKVIIADGRNIEVGSFNYTRAAERVNSENVLVVWDVPVVAQRYLQHWQSRWNGGTDWHSSLRLAGQRGAQRVPRPFHRLRAGLRGGLLRGVERLPCAAYAADVGDQCHFGHYRGWRVVADRPRRLGQLPELYRGADRQH